MPVLCELIVLACLTPDEITTVRDLAVHLRLHVRSLERRCQATGTTARDVATFVACAQVIIFGNETEWLLRNQFADKDPRTAWRLIELGGLNVPKRPRIDDFIRNQRFITPRHVQELLIQKFNDRLNPDPVQGRLIDESIRDSERRPRRRG